MELSDDVLRPALEVAFAVAVAGQRLKPRMPAPAPLRPYLKFQKLPNAALPVVRRVLEEDPAFRTRVAGVATEELAGAVGLLWLARPDGWERDLAAAVAESEEAERVDESGSALAQARRRQEAADQAALRARGALAAVREELERERARRQELELQSRQVGAELAEARRVLACRDQELVERQEQARADRRTRDEANVARKQLQEELTSATRLLEDVLAARAALEARVHHLEEAAARPATPTGPADDGVPPANRPGPAAPRAFAAGAEPGAVPDLAAVSEGLARAATATAALAAALQETAALLRGEGGGPLAPGDVGAMPTAPAATGPTTAAGPVVATRGGPRAARANAVRHPLALPGGVLHDEVAAAEHLLRAGALVVVDGYNVAMLGWPDRPLADQRERLLDALEDLVRRVGTRLLVVFDGADVTGVFHGRRLLRVRFSPAGVSADDAIRGEVAAHPSGEPVVVVTNDQAIRGDVARIGANLLRSEQLLAVAVR